MLFSSNRGFRRTPLCSHRSIRVLAALLPLVALLGSASAQVSDDFCTEESVRISIATGGRVVLDCGTNLITLTRPVIIEQDTTISSSAATNEVVITGGGLTRLFVVQPGVRFRLEGVALFSGRQTETNAHHGGVPDTAGAAIYNDRGIVEVFRGRFDNHSVLGITGAAGDSGGDGERGEDGGDAAGAAIYNREGSIVVSNSVFRANSVLGGPGGNGGEGRNDTGDGGNGGSAGGAAIYSQGGTVKVFNTVFTNNTATASIAGAAGASTGMLSFPGDSGEAGDAVGAAVAGANASITIYGCTFVNNKAVAADGANGTAGVRNLEGRTGGGGGDAAGGALYSTGPLEVTNSTFFQNSATSGKGGAGGAGGPASFGFDGGDGGNGGRASGGAVEAAGGGVIVHCTFSDNTLTAGAAGAGGAGGGSLGDDGDAGSAGVTTGGAIYASSASLSLANSILTRSAVLTIAGTILDRGGNISSDASPLMNSVFSYPRRNPMLRPLANNGGPTPTMAVPTNSPAVTNLAFADFCAEFDQRGSNRLGCDIGAFEVVTAPPVVFPTDLTISASLVTNTLVMQFPKLTNMFVETSRTLPGTNWTTLTTIAPSLVTNDSTVTSILKIPVQSATPTPTRFFRLSSTNRVTGPPVLPPPTSPENPAPPQQPPGSPGLPPLPGQP